MKFQYMLTGVTAGHGAQAVQAINVPVSVGGMDVAPGRSSTWMRMARSNSLPTSWKRC